jgi:glycine amidinotransferase
VGPEESMTRINSWNEWDPLRHVIVGRIDSRMVGAPERGMVNVYPRLGLGVGEWVPIPDEYLQRAGEQMERFVALLQQRGITVDRPTSLDDRQYVRTPFWECSHTFGTMPPRDILLCYGNEILEATMSQRARWFEFLSYKPLLERYFKEDPNFLWEVAPKPRLAEDSYMPGYWESFHAGWSAEELAARAERFEWQLSEQEPLFDAADVMRFGKDLFIQHSAPTNRSGIEWFRRHFEARGFRVHECAFGGTPQPWHMDVTIAGLRPGLLLVNPQYPSLVPEFHQLFRINDWEIVEAVPPSGAEQPPYSFCHDVLGYNVLSLDPETVCVEASEVALMEQLDGLGLGVVPVEFLEVSMFGGGLHCATLDIERDGGMEDYFPKQIPGF